MSERAPSSTGHRRWATSAAVAALLHVAAVGAFFVHLSTAAPDTVHRTAIAIDMAALPTAPPTPDHDVPTPKQTNAPAQKVQKKPVVKPLPFTPPPKLALTDVKPEVVLPTQPEESQETKKSSAQPPSDQNTRESAPDFAPDKKVAAPVVGGFNPGDNSPQALWVSQVLGKIQKLKRYPPLARVRNERDDVEIRVSFDRTGKVVSAQLVHSAGFELLDKESLDVLRRGSPFPEPPPEVAGEVITLPLTMQFDFPTSPASSSVSR